LFSAHSLHSWKTSTDLAGLGGPRTARDECAATAAAAAAAAAAMAAAPNSLGRKGIRERGLASAQGGKERKALAAALAAAAGEMACFN